MLSEILEDPFSKDSVLLMTNVEAKSIEVYKNPEGRDYKEKIIYSVEDTIAFPVFVNGDMKVKELF